MKSLKDKLKRTKKNDVLDFLSPKEINKKLKEFLTKKEKEPDNEKEFILYKIIISLNHLLKYNSSIEDKSNFGQELNFSDIIYFFDFFKEKAFYSVKIYPLLEIIKTLYLHNSKGKIFLKTIQDIFQTVNKEKKITDNQIDRINYILITHYDTLLNLNTDSFNIFLCLKGIYKYIYYNHKYLVDYYNLIQLKFFNEIDLKKIIDNKKIYQGQLIDLLIDIIDYSTNEVILETAFEIFCKYFHYFKENFVFFKQQKKLILLIIKYLIIYKNNNAMSFLDNKFNLCKLIHDKYNLGEMQRNKERNCPSLNGNSVNKNNKINNKGGSTRKILTSSTTKINLINKLKNKKNLPVKNKSKEKNLSKRSSSALYLTPFSENKYQTASLFLYDDKKEKYPDDLFAVKTPSQFFIIQLYKFIEKEKFKVINDKNYLKKVKEEILKGVLYLANKILKNYDSDFFEEEQYFCKKLFNEALKILKTENDYHISKKCLYILGNIISKNNYYIIFLPEILQKIVENSVLSNIDKMANCLYYFIKECNQILLIYNNDCLDDDNIISKKLNEFAMDKIFINCIIMINEYVFREKKFRADTVKNKGDKNNFNNNNNILFMESYFFFNCFFLERYLYIHYGCFGNNIEFLITTLIEKSNKEFVRNYMLNIINSINSKKLFVWMLKNVLIDKKKGMHMKLLFYLMRNLLKNKKQRNKYIFFLDFLDNNIKNISKNSYPKIIEYLSEHLVYEETKFYFNEFEIINNNVINNSNNFFYTHSSKISNTSNNSFCHIFDLKYNHTSDNVLIADVIENKNLKFLNSLINIIFICINTEAKPLDEISFLIKLLKPIFLNLLPLSKINRNKILIYINNYSLNLKNLIEKDKKKENYKKLEKNIKIFLELLGYTHSYITKYNNIDSSNGNIDNDLIIKNYKKIVSNLFKIFPDFSIYRDYETLNIFQVAFSYLITISNLSVKIDDSDFSSIELLNIINKLLLDKKLKPSNTFYSSMINIYYILYQLRKVSDKPYFDVVYSIIINVLNFDDFQENNILINISNFILVNLCMQILLEKPDSITKECFDVLTVYDKNHLIEKLKKFSDDYIAQIKKRGSCLNTNKIHYKQKKNFRISLLKDGVDFSEKSNFFKFKNFEVTSDIILNISDIIYDEYEHNKNNMNYKFKRWDNLNMIVNASNNPNNNKNKKNGFYKTQDINKMQFLLNESLSPVIKKNIFYISIIKSINIDNNDFELFKDFLGILGDVGILNNVKIFIKKNNLFENYIYEFQEKQNKKLRNLTIILTKNYFEEYDVNFCGNFIMYVKPLRIIGIYAIKIVKNSNFNLKNNVSFRSLIQIDKEFNLIYPDLIIINTKNESEILNFLYIIEIIYRFSFIEMELNDYS